jgi:diguanylate cyclase (GGDEF)-like protein
MEPTIKRRPDLTRFAKLHSVLPPPRERLAVTVIVMVTAILGMLLLQGTSRMATIWPANGVLLAILLTSRRSHWPAYLACGYVANLLAAYLVGFHFNFVVRFPLVNLLELSFTLLLLRYFVGDNYDLSQPKILWRFSLIAAVLSPAVSTVLNALLFSFLTTHGIHAYFFLSVFFAHALGIITVTPVALALRGQRYSRLATKPRLVLSLAVSGLFLVTTLFVFTQSRDQLLFLVYPPLVFVVCCFGLVGGAVALFLTTVISIGFPLYGHGLALLGGGAADLNHIIMLQFFVSVAAMLVLPLSAILAERDRAELQLQDAKERLAALAHTDPLTGLANRRRLDEALDQECRRANRNREPLSLLLLDVDNFKSFNDQYGHQAGDECLRAVSEVVKQFGRRPGDLAARYGGEELAVLLAPAPDNAAQLRAEALRKAVQDLRLAHAGNRGCGVVTVSIGVATVYPESGFATPKMLVERADEMLYEAKRHGRNRVMVSA